MSIMSYLQSVESVLKAEFDGREDLIVFRPGMRRAYGRCDREIALPNMGADAFTMAAGAAMTGICAVLDLRSAEDCAELLAEGFERMPRGVCLPVVVLCLAGDEIEIPEGMPVGVYCPQSPCEAAGFMRAALRSGEMSIVMLDEDCLDMLDEVPDDGDFMLLPDDGDQWEDVVPEGAPFDAWYDERHEVQCSEEEAEERAAQESEPMRADEVDVQPVDACAEFEQDGEERMQEEKAAVRQSGNAANMCSMRMLCYDPTRLDALAEELNAARRVLVEKCVMRVYERCPDFECRYEEEAFEGECACLPPEQGNAAIWIGRDRISVTYDSVKMGHEAAARLLREICRLLVKPTLLIYDGEDSAS